MWSLIIIPLQILPSLARALPNIVTMQKDTLTDNEVTLIRSVEWLVVIPETYFDALRQSNAILRYFLCRFFFLSYFFRVFSVEFRN